MMHMINYEDSIGRNIKEVRKECRFKQEELSKKCGISSSTLSAYENSKKTPNLITIAKIAKALGVSIERLYYGDENISFINSVPDEGRKIVNCIYHLWELGVISYYEKFFTGIPGFNSVENEQSGLFLRIDKHAMSIKRLINALNEFQSRKSTYADAEKYLEMLLDSFATEINESIAKEID